MRIHELKTDPSAFDAIAAGNKRFELRYNDRNFRVGDKLLLRETRYSGEEMTKGAPLEYTGIYLTVFITSILTGPVYGLLEGWVIMSIALIEKAEILRENTTLHLWEEGN